MQCMLQEARYRHPPSATVARRATEQASMYDPSDVHSLRQRFVPFLLDPGAVCSTMPSVRTQVIDAYSGRIRAHGWSCVAGGAG
jgi:hypothetical protein